jgi:hypothetical protein
MSDQLEEQALPDVRSRWTIDIVIGKSLGILYCVASGDGLTSGVEITMPERGWVNIYDSYDRAIWFQRHVVGEKLKTLPIDWHH